MNRFFAFIASMIIFSGAGFSEAAQSTPKKIDSLMQEALVKLKVAGAYIAVVKDGKIMLQKGYGLNSIETKLLVDDLTNFQIASNSKAFTVALCNFMMRIVLPFNGITAI